MKQHHDSATPAHGQQVFTAVAFIHSLIDGEHKVFLAKRAETKEFLPGVYEMPGGHIDFGEDIVAGLKRELVEEFNMHIAVGDPFGVFTYVNEVKGSHSIEVVYFASFTSDLQQLHTNPEDHSAFGWFSEDEVAQTRNNRVPDNDPEYAIIQKGFALLNNQPLDFGKPKE